MKIAESKKLELGHFVRLIDAMRLVWESKPSLTLGNISLRILQGVLLLAVLYLMKLVVDGISATVTATDQAAAFERVVFLIALAGVVVLLSFLCRAISNAVRTIQGKVVSDHVYDIIHAKSIELDLEYYENSDFHDKLHLTKQEAPYRPANIANSLGTLVESSISLIAIVGLICSFHWAVPVVIFVATLPGVFLRLSYADEMHDWRLGKSALERRGGYLHHLLLSDLDAKEIRLFRLGPVFMERFREVREQLLKESLNIIKKQSFGEMVTVAGGTLAVFGCYTYIAYRTVHGAITLGDLVMYLGAFSRGQSVLQTLIASMVDIFENSLFLTNLYEFLDLKKNVVEPAYPKPIPSPMRRGIVFDNVSFRYPKTRRMVLKDINLIIRPGDVIGLVGENGSGKTTLIKLLCRFYDPTEGSIELDGISLKQFQTAALRRQMSVIFQNYRRYHVTLRENIWFGDIELPLYDEKIAKAAMDSGLDSVIARFEKGYETIVGKWFESGEELSIGQSQKLALARALFRDAQLLVLDEPTSALDAKAEYEFFKKIRQMGGGRTIILISHRLSTLKMADRIYVLRDKTIIESGNHSELVENGGTYAELFEIQAKAYR